MLFFYLLFIIKVVFILLSIAFITLFERKILSYSQNRLGPNKVFFVGFFQPVFDGLKLLMKELVFPMKDFFWGFILGPLVGFFVMLFLWMVFNSIFVSQKSFYGFVFIMVFIGLGVYSTLISGWSSTSKFASLGAVRSCSQSVSYEISLVFFIFCFLLMQNTCGLSESLNIFLFLLMPLFFMTCVAETNRAPFDFSEGESELISGFNLEFGSSLFVFLFLAEYGMIIFFSLLMSVIFFDFFFLFMCMFFVFIFIRSVFPRFRYDLLMKLTWTKFLPLSLGLIGLFFFCF